MDELMAFYQNGLLCMAMSLDAAAEGQAVPADGEAGSGRDAAPWRLPAAPCESGLAPASAAG